MARFNEETVGEAIVYYENEITNLDGFVENAISADGRGAFLAMYDNEEHEILIDGTWYYIYKN